MSIFSHGSIKGKSQVWIYHYIEDDQANATMFPSDHGRQTAIP